MNNNKVNYSSLRTTKTYEDKANATKVIQLLLSRVKSATTILSIEDLIIIHDIAYICDSLSYWNSKGLLKEEIELYKKLAKQYATIIKDLFFLSNENKPKSFLEDLKKFDNETDIEYNQRMFDIEEKFKDAFDILARLGDFDSYCVAMEWYRPESSRFYLPRRNVLIRHGIIQDLQDLNDGVIIIYLLEAPPSIGKSVLGSLWCAFRNGQNSNARGLIGNANSALTKGFFNDIYTFLVDSEYRHNEIFGTRKVISDVEYTSLYFDKRKREPNVMCRSVESGATGIIHINKEGYLYLDDTIKGAEEANSKERLQKIIYSITSTFMDRRENEFVPVLHIGTPWSLYDFASYLKGMYGTENWFRVKSIPAYYVDDNGKEITNFDYEGKHYKSVKYWKQQIEIDDPVIANAKFLMKPMERDGRLFDNVLTFTLEEFKTAIKEEKPYICSACDVAVSKGGDYFAQGFFYVFEKRKEILLPDVIYSNKGTDYTLPLSAKKLIYHNVEKVEYEEKEGSLNKEVNYGVADKVREFVKIHNWQTINFSSHSGAGLKSKSNRIDTFQAEIRGVYMPDRYILKFLDKKDRISNYEYNLAMQHLFSYSASSNAIGKQFDDFPDMLSMNFAYNIKNKKKVRFFNIKI